MDAVSSTGSVMNVGSSSVVAGPFNCPNGFMGVQLLIGTDSSGLTLRANDVLRLQVRATGAGGNLQLGFDTAAYPATLDLPVFSGVG